MTSKGSLGTGTKTAIGEIERRWPLWFNEDPPELEWVLKSTARVHAQVSVILFVFETGCADPTLVAKVSRHPEFSPVVVNEFNRIREARSLMGPLGSETIPEALDLVPVGADTYLITRYAPQDRHWEQDPEPSRADALDRLARWLAGLHSSSERARRSTDTSVDRISGVFMEAFGPNDRVAVRTLEEAEELVMEESRTSRSEMLVHGDFWPGNWRLFGEDFKVIDWEHARWSSSTVIDEFLLPLSLAVANPAVGGMSDHVDTRKLSDIYRTHRGLPRRDPDEARLAAVWCAAEIATRPFRRWGVVEDWSFQWRDQVIRMMEKSFDT